MRMLAAIVLMCGFVSLCAARSAAPKPADSALIESERRLMEAEQKGDNAAVARVLSEGFSAVGVDGKLSGRQEILDSLDGTVELTPYNFKVISVSDDAAVVTYDVIAKTPPAEDQGPPPRYQHVSSVWARQAGEWKLKFQQTTAIHWGDW